MRGGRGALHALRALAAVNLLGDAVHHFIDGLMIGASYLVSMPIGISTSLAVLLHKSLRVLLTQTSLIAAGIAVMGPWPRSASGQDRSP